MVLLNIEDKVTVVSCIALAQIISEQTMMYRNITGDNNEFKTVENLKNGIKIK